jgi:hypothetical protein
MGVGRLAWLALLGLLGAVAPVAAVPLGRRLLDDAPTNVSLPDLANSYYDSTGTAALTVLGGLLPLCSAATVGKVVCSESRSSTGPFLIPSSCLVLRC